VQRDEVLTVQQAARMLGVSIDTVRTWADAGRIPSWRTPGRHRRFSAAALQNLQNVPSLRDGFVSVR
jgi:excisionase family DNA binding protein